MNAAPRTHHNVTFIVLAAGVSAYALLQSLVVPVLTTVQAQFHTSQANATWVLTAYLVAASVFTPIMGRIGDMIGKERVFVATLVALAVGSLLGALAHSFALLVVARVVQGVGGGVLPLAFGIIRDEFPRDKVVAAISSLATLVGVGSGIGIVLAGPIVNGLGFAWLFWFPLMLTVAAAVAAVLFVPESPVRTPGRISIVPAVLLSAWLVALLVALSEAPVWGWGSGRVLGLFAVAVVLAVAWVASENRVAVPLVDMKMMRHKPVWTTNIAALLVGLGMYSMMAFLPEFLQTPSSAGYGFGASITESGLILLPASVTMFIVGQYVGRLTARVGAKALVVAGGVISAISMVGFALLNDQKWEMYVGTGLFGIGIGLAFSSMSALIVEAVPAEQTGVASGMNANIRTIGGSIGSALMASIVTAHVQPSGLPNGSGYTAGFLMLAGGLAVAALAGLIIPVVRRADGADEVVAAATAQATDGVPA